MEGKITMLNQKGWGMISSPPTYIGNSRLYFQRSELHGIGFVDSLAHDVAFDVMETPGGTRAAVRVRANPQGQAR